MEQQAAQQNGEGSVSTSSSNHGTHPIEVARKIAVVAPHTAMAEGPTLSKSESTQEDDKFVGTGGPLTPVPSNLAPSTGNSFIDPDLSLIALDDEPTGLNECSNTTCPSGGLHMVDHKSMVAFAKRVNRLRYHSHCISGSDYNASLGPSPGTSPSSTSSTTGHFNGRSRFMQRSLSCPDIKKPAVDDKEGGLRSKLKLWRISFT